MYRYHTPKGRLYRALVYAVAYPADFSSHRKSRKQARYRREARINSDAAMNATAVLPCNILHGKNAVIRDENNSHRMPHCKKKSFMPTVVGYSAALFLCAFTVMHIYSAFASDIIFGVAVDGEIIGTVRNPFEITDARAELEHDISAYTGMNYKYKNDVQLTMKSTRDSAVDTERLDYSACYTALNSFADNGLSDGYILYIDNLQIGANSDITVIQNAIDAAENTYYSTLKNDDPKITAVNILNNVEIKSGLIAVCAQDTSDTLLAKLCGGKTIAMKYKIIRTETFTETVPVTTVTREDDTLLVGREKDVIEGSDGIDEVTCIVEFVDENEISRTEISRTALVEMNPNIHFIGSKPIPPTESTGKYIWPMDGDIWITSFWGEQREEFDGGAFHFGIDIDAEEGTMVMAADGGTVSYNATSRSYGTMVIIDHIGGYRTCYAHLSESLVQLGDKIYPGQYIAKSGNSGISTAPHLHFEMRVGEFTVDPLDYLPPIVFRLERANMTMDVMR